MAYISKNLTTLIPRLGTGEDDGDASATSAMHVYRSVTDARSVIIGAGYIDDGNDKGIKVNDFVIVVDDGAAATLHIVTVVDAAGDVTMGARPAIP